MCLLLQMEQVHVLTQTAMVALCGFLKTEQMCVQLLFVQPAGAVNTAQLWVVLVTAPIGTGNARELKRGRIKLTRRRQMRAAAHVHPVIARPIDRKLFAFGQFRRPFRLEAFARILPCRNQRITRHNFAAQRLIRSDDGTHLFFNRGQVVHREWATRCGRHHVIIKSVVGRRAKCNLRSGEQALHRFGKDMRKVMAGELKRVRLITAGHQCELRIGLQRARDIAQFAIHPRGNRSLRKAGANGGGNIRRGSAARDFTGSAIGKGNADHLGHGFTCFQLRFGTAPLPVQTRSRNPAALSLCAIPFSCRAAPNWILARSLLGAIRHEIAKATDTAGHAAGTIHQAENITATFLAAKLFGDDDITVACKARTR